MAERKQGKLGVGDLIRGWGAVLGAFVAGALLRWGGPDMTQGIPHARAFAYAVFGFGGLFALALLFHGTEFGFRVQSLLLCGVSGAGAFVFASIGLDKGWGVGSGALTFVFSLFALVKLKHALLGRAPPPEEG